MSGPARRVGSILCGALAGASGWISLGTMAVTDESSGARVAALPPLWVLAAGIVLGASAAALLRLSTSRVWPLAVVGLLWLPYLPGQWPAAFLMWQGPAELWVWCAAIRWR